MVSSFAETAWIAALLAIAVLVAYSPALHGDFVWDDDAHVTRPELRSIDGLGRIWFDIGATQQYYPLLHSAFWLEHRLWGNAVTGYHVANILFHAASASMIVLILRRLDVPGAPLAAALFALHPVNVESVAWISEQKNTLSMVFYLGALYAYLRFDRERRTSLYLIASALFVLGLLTKTVVATLPGALLVILWWKRGRLSLRQDLLPLEPWIALGGVAGLLTARFESRLLGAESAEFSLTLLQRILLAGRVVWFYLGKLLWPVNLAFIYPRWVIDVSAWPQYLFPLAAPAVVAAGWMFRGRSRTPLALTLLFVGSMFPVLGFVNVYPFVFSFVADHFQYVPSVAIATAVTAGVTRLAARVGPRARRAVQAGALAVLAALGASTWIHSHAFTDPETLYAATLDKNPDCYLCLNNLATHDAQEGRLDEAIERYRQALRIKPDSPEAHNNLGSALAQSGRVAEGISELEKALEAAPNSVSARTNLGILLYSVGRIADAKAQFEAALGIMPDYRPAQHNLAVIKARPNGTRPD